MINIFFYNYYVNGVGNYPNIKNIRIGNSVTSIGYGAFYKCISLTTVTIGNSVTSIGNYSFSGCSSLTTIVIKSTNQLTFDSSVFWKCQKLSTIYFYSWIEPNYSTAISCWSPSCGSSSSPVSCAPFYCDTPDEITVYVPKNYNTTATTFAGKSVTFKREL